jgi:hypothetical protein
MSRLKLERDFDSVLKPTSVRQVAAVESEWGQDARPSRALSLELGRRNAPRRKRHHIWIPLFAPVIAIVILAITVWFQSGQLTATREANEDSQFREVIKTVAQAHNTESEFPAFLLFKPFLTSKRYRDTTRQLIITILPRVELYDTFEDLLRSLFPNPTLAEADSLARIARTQTRRLHFLDHRLEHLKHDPPIDGALKAHMEEDAVGHQREALLEEISLVNNYLGKAMSSPSAGAGSVDLSRLLFYRCDWSNREFHGVNIEGANFDGVDLKGAELRGITGFESSDWTGTAWWRAKSVDGNLLRYLAQKFPYRRSDHYPWDSQIAPTDYDQNVQRLETGLVQGH